MRPIVLEIISKFITTFDPRRHCKILFNQAGLEQEFREKEINEYPPNLREEFNNEGFSRFLLR